MSKPTSNAKQQAIHVPTSGEAFRLAYIDVASMYYLVYKWALVLTGICPQSNGSLRSDQSPFAHHRRFDCFKLVPGEHNYTD